MIEKKDRNDIDKRNKNFENINVKFLKHWAYSYEIKSLHIHHNYTSLAKVAMDCCKQNLTTVFEKEYE